MTSVSERRSHPRNGYSAQPVLVGGGGKVVVLLFGVARGLTVVSYYAFSEIYF